MLSLASPTRPTPPADAAAAAPQTVHWLGMRLELPGDWAIVRHSVDTAKGRLAVVDRDAQRLLLTWCPMPQEPDWARHFSDQQALELEEHPDALFVDLPAELQPWRGFVRVSARRQVYRAALLDEPRRRMVEAVIPARDDDQARHAAELLAHFAVTTPDAGKTDRFRAFDLDVTAPAEWELQRVLVTLGRVEVRYGRGRSQAIVRRLGMAASWYNGDAAALARYTAKDTAGREEPLTHPDGPGVMVIGHEKVKRIVTFTGRRRRQLDAVWHDRAANAVVHVTVLTPRRDDASPHDFQVHAIDPYDPAEALA